MNKKDLFKINVCNHCGLCNIHCPFFYIYRKEHISPRGFIFSLQKNLKINIEREILPYCAFCEKCYENCALEVDLPGFLLYSIYEKYKGKEWIVKYKKEKNFFILEFDINYLWQTERVKYGEKIKVKSLKELEKLKFIKSSFLQSLLKTLKKYDLPLPLREEIVVKTDINVTKKDVIKHLKKWNLSC